MILMVDAKWTYIFFKSDFHIHNLKMREVSGVAASVGDAFRRRRKKKMSVHAVKSKKSVSQVLMEELVKRRRKRRRNMLRMLASLSAKDKSCAKAPKEKESGLNSLASAPAQSKCMEMAMRPDSPYAQLEKLVDEKVDEAYATGLGPSVIEIYRVSRWDDTHKILREIMGKSKYLPYKYHESEPSCNCRISCGCPRTYSLVLK